MCLSYILDKLKILILRPMQNGGANGLIRKQTFLRMITTGNWSPRATLFNPGLYHT